MLPFTKQERLVFAVIFAVFLGGTLLRVIFKFYPACNQSLNFLDAGYLQSKVNLNTATAQELDAIPGLGPVITGKIIDGRSHNGGFMALEELNNVPGIGPAIFKKISPYLEIK